MLSEGRIQTTDQAGGEGVLGPLRLGKSFEAMVADAHPKYYDAVRRGNVYSAVNTAAGVITVAATAAATGLFLWNPPNSGKSLVLLRLNVALQSLPAGAAGLVLVGGAQPLVGAVTWTYLTGTGAVNGVGTSFMGQGAPARSVAQALSAANLLAQTIIQRWIPGGPAATVAGSVSWTPFIQDNIDGELIIGPGQYVGLQTVTTVMTGAASLTWEEVPVA